MARRIKVPSETEGVPSVGGSILQVTEWDEGDAAAQAGSRLEFLQSRELAQSRSAVARRLVLFSPFDPEWSLKT